MQKYDIIGATGCATGIAHTFMAQEALEEAAKKLGYTIKIETHGQSGTEHVLTEEEIKEAKAVVIASDIDVDPDRFAGKHVIKVPVAKAIKDAEGLINKSFTAPIWKPELVGKSNSNITKNQSSDSIGQQWYTALMNGVSHMLPFVVAGGVLTAISFFWGIYSYDPKSAQYNLIAATLKSIGGVSINLMAPVFAAFIAESLSKRAGLVAGLVTGMIALNGGTGFLGALVGGFIAAYIVKLVEMCFTWLPDKQFRGLKSIFLTPVFSVLLSGVVMTLINTPMAALNTGLMDWLKTVQNVSPILLGIIVGAMCAFDFGGPVNKAAYLTGTALLAQGNYYFMAGVSAACIAPPLATTVAVLLKPKAYSKSERSAGYVNALLGSTHITEGAIPFAAKNPIKNIPAFMVGSAIAAALSYVGKVQVPAPHGGFIILPLVNHPLMWVIYILIGAIASGILLALIAGSDVKKARANGPRVDIFTGEVIEEDDKETSNAKENIVSNKLNPADILEEQNIKVGVKVNSRNEALQFLAEMAKEQGLATDSEKVYNAYLKREQESTTGMTDGFSIPHAQSDTIKKSKMLILKLNKPIDWNSLDNKPVDVVISFLIPQEDKSEHLEYLSNTAKLLTHKDFVDKIHAAKTPKEIKSLFN
ncbi:fructose-specific PTS transporter subunit EIIC [Ligilactobacillus equi]|uniref:Phosphoenolpyruvate-dependent sugar phosphotransferase system EIIABC, putative fructose specific n=1 Tax=Ligilactobacillus equi DPC 6820 TaxID=1392007 RepID=V7HYR2_9LACO|nr:fructose-specific PTS transporter subunit EIIC [Ligilactobacillus equi]ETA75022.1 phosphoenolpyruvate-dependent sugar phosphotransferase system EIIABC, putative fructose specific [Ligilactobacillus equi DPC 6820]